MCETLHVGIKSVQKVGGDNLGMLKNRDLPYAKA